VLASMAAPRRMNLLRASESADDVASCIMAEVYTGDGQTGRPMPEYLR